MPLHSLDFTIVFYDYTLAMNYSIRYLNSHMRDKTSVIIIFHLFDPSSEHDAILRRLR